MKEAALAVRCRDLRLILTDVDGVLTDGTLWIAPDGSERKGFHSRDGLGFHLARAGGLETGMVSGRSSDVVTRRAKELGVEIVLQGIRDKKDAVQKLLDARGLTWPNVAFIGDDLVDVGAMNAAALSAAPADAPMEVRAQAFMITEAAGGRGCFREFVEAILRARGDWDRVALEYFGAPA
jgi:3-deoxy-D-manno-octulosonate 8-phosphate phosphatase (KDO 8-P phosphatase)